jgi:hypothetical protein
MSSGTIYSEHTFTVLTFQSQTDSHPCRDPIDNQIDYWVSRNILLEFKHILSPRGFDPRGPKSEEAYIYRSPRAYIYMCICLYKILYWKKSQFSQSKAVKDLWVITASSIGNEKECSHAHAPFWCRSVHSVDLKAIRRLEKDPDCMQRFITRGQM